MRGVWRWATEGISQAEARLYLALIAMGLAAFMVGTAGDTYGWWEVGGYNDLNAGQVLLGLAPDDSMF